MKDVPPRSNTACDQGSADILFWSSAHVYAYSVPNVCETPQVPILKRLRDGSVVVYVNFVGSQGALLLGEFTQFLAEVFALLRCNLCSL